MEHDELERVVRSILEDETELTIGHLDAHADLTDAGIDSLDVVKVAAQMERRFDVTITTDELLELRTINDIVLGLASKSV